MTRRFAPIAVFGCALALAGCGASPPDTGVPAAASALRPKPNFYLRASGFDQDPSAYLGRFVPDDVAPAAIDEAGAMKLACSEHFVVRKVPAGGVELDEYFAAGSAAAANLGLAGAGGSAGAERTSVVRVRYTLTEKWIADLEDPAAFEACCKRAGDQCPRRIIGEFLAGTGEIFTAARRADGAQGSGGAAGFEVKDGVAWSRRVRFTQPVFFAFRVTENRFTGAGMCDRDWAAAPPRSSQGRYFVGISDWLESERVARDQAMLDARRQVVRYLGERITQGAELQESLGGRAAALQASLNDEGFLRRGSGAVARFVKDECWQPAKQEGPEGWRYQAKVLAFVPESAVAEAARALGDAVK